jgi:uncharacterized protein (TIGR00369 family)
MADALSAEVERRVRESFARQGFMKKLGVAMDLIGRGICELSTRHDETLTQQNGFFHAGVTAAIADSAAGYAAFSMMPENAAVLTTEFKLNLLAPAKGPRLLARGRVIKSGRTLFVVEANVYSGPTGEETHVAVMMATEMCLMNKDDR